MKPTSNPNHASPANSVRCAGCQLKLESEPDSESIESEISRSDELLDLLAARKRNGQFRYLGRGLGRLRDLRVRGIRRRLKGCCIGLPSEYPEAFFETLPRDFRRVALPDYEVLEWRVYTLQYIDRMWLPVTSAGAVLPALGADDLRAWLGRSQSFINKYASLYPRVDEEYIGRGVALEVPTKQFFREMSSPKLRCMRSIACLQHSRIG